MKEFPVSASTPDIFDTEPFWLERHGDFALLAFRDIAPLAIRHGGRAVLAYPLVMAAIEIQSNIPVCMIAVEVGAMTSKTFLCGFNDDGDHLNFGTWDLDAGVENFVERAKSLVTRTLDQSVTK